MLNNNYLLEYPLFYRFNQLLAFTSTKKTFLNNLTRFTGNDLDEFQHNREQLAEILEIKPNQLVFPRQTHSNKVLEILKIPEQEILDIDALVTNKTGICICVQTADCVPILLFDPARNVIAVVHAGWRGTVAKIVSETVALIKNNYKCAPENILAVIGPSISPEVYEVGEEVKNAAIKNIPNSEKTILTKTESKIHFNLWEANRQLLLLEGVPADNIQITGECSFNQKDKYFSARRDGTNTGRMVSGIMLV